MQRCLALCLAVSALLAAPAVPAQGRCPGTDATVVQGVPVGAGGAAQVHATVTADGRVLDVRVVDAPGLSPAQRRAVVASVANWQFHPATRCGVAVDQRVAMKVPLEAVNGAGPGVPGTAGDGP